MSLFWYLADKTSYRGVRPAGKRARMPGGETASVPDAAIVRSPARTPLTEPIVVLALLTGFFSLLFLAVPQIDLMVSGWFVSSTQGFWLSNVPILIEVRDLNRQLPVILLIATVAALGAKAAGARWRWLPRPHLTLFILVFYALGPGLVVNGLKLLFGRARPNQTVEFGGTLDFTPAWELSDACARNCSFSSGEAGSAVAMFAFLVLLPRRWQRPAFLALLPVVLLFSLNRLVFGAHYLSDVVISWLLVSLVLLALWPAFQRSGPQIDRAVTGSAIPLFDRAARALGAGRLRLAGRRLPG